MARRRHVWILFRALLRPPFMDVFEGPARLWQWSQRPSVQSVVSQTWRRDGKWTVAEECDEGGEMLGRW